MKKLNLALLYCTLAFVALFFSCSKDNKGKDSTQEQLDVLEGEQSLIDAEVLDSAEIADRERMALYSLRNNIFNNGWFYKCIERTDFSGDIPSDVSPYNSSETINYLVYRIRLSDSKKEVLFGKKKFVQLITIDNNYLYFGYNSKLYKQRIHSKESILLKENDIYDAIVFGGRLYYTQLGDNKQRAIYSMKIDGSDDKRLTEYNYRNRSNFCIYKGMIFAKNNLSEELEMLDISGNLIDSLGKVDYHYFVYDSCIYLISNLNVYKINIETKKKQLLKSNQFISNPLIARNRLFFNTPNGHVEINGHYEDSYGDFCSINLETGELKIIDKKHPCSLIDAYNGILYYKGWAKYDSDNESVVGFQINMDGTDKKNMELY
ncbi:MAG: DUF5050 domain-containing protein [Dysgonamonadaceae bacterium]|jgi:hypothetical protein|nr:DUF5050 domain-containing protein [Dysgonamonadaceae bacterium]